MCGLVSAGQSAWIESESVRLQTSDAAKPGKLTRITPPSTVLPRKGSTGEAQGWCTMVERVVRGVDGGTGVVRPSTTTSSNLFCLQFDNQIRIPTKQRDLTRMPPSSTVLPRNVVPPNSAPVKPGTVLDATQASNKSAEGTMVQGGPQQVGQGGGNTGSNTRRTSGGGVGLRATSEETNRGRGGGARSQRRNEQLP